MRCGVWLLLLGCLAAPQVRAQAPATAPAQPAAVPLIPWRQNVFTIPFQITRPPGRPDSPVEVQLYLSQDQGQSWRLAQRVPPQQGKFTFRVNADGEYWFAMRTLGANGLFLDDGTLTPGIKVQVDTQAPKLELRSQRGPSGEVQLTWQVIDPAVDANSLRIEYQSSPEAPWRPLSIGAMQAGQLPGTAVGSAAFWSGHGTDTVSIRAEVTDRAGNRTVSQTQLTADGPPASNAGANQVANQPPRDPKQENYTPNHPNHQAQNPQNNGSQASQTQNPFTVQANNAAQAGNGAVNGGANSPANQSVPSSANAGTDPRYAANAGNAARPGANWQGDDVFRAPPAQAQGWPADRIAQAPLEQSGPLTARGERYFADRAGANGINNGPAPGSTFQLASQSTGGVQVTQPSLGFDLPRGAKVRMVNSPAFELQYDLAAVGPAGVGKVELWGTRDGGQSWSLFGVDPDAKSPVPAEVRFEGVYGFRIVVHSGDGQSGPLPQPGDAPEVWVGVDLSPPRGELLAVEPGENDINIRWIASDPFLAKKPVTLSYGLSPNGPWTQITTGQAAQGAYTWQPTREVPEAVFIQLQAADEAGNTTTAVSRQSIALPHHRPQGRIRDVQPVAPSAARQEGSWYR